MSNLFKSLMRIDRSKKFSNFFDRVEFERKIDFIILHHIESNSADEAIALLEKNGVSSHFLIDENGDILQLVDENNIAYHAGVSNWLGFEGLNKNSIGIEFLNKNAFGKKFETAQMLAGLELIKDLMQKFNISKKSVIGHSDIAYSRDTKMLDRKQDPSHLFDWKFLAQNNAALCPEVFINDDKILFKAGDKNSAIESTKENLAKFGYKITNLNDDFDDEMTCLVRVFNRRFNQEKFNVNSDVWYLSSQKILEELIL